MTNVTHPSPEVLFDDEMESLICRAPHRSPAYPAFLDGLSQRQRHLWVLGMFLCQVGNGGLAQWVDNGYEEQDGAALLLALAHLNTQGVPHAELVRGVVERVIRLIANDEPDGDDDRTPSENAYEAMWLLDDEYFPHHDAFKAAVYDYFALGAVA